MLQSVVTPVRLVIAAGVGITLASALSYWISPPIIGLATGVTFMIVVGGLQKWTHGAISGAAIGALVTGITSGLGLQPALLNPLGAGAALGFIIGAVVGGIVQAVKQSRRKSGPAQTDGWHAVTDVVRPTQPRKRRLLRVILLLAAVLTTPLLCCGTIRVVDAVPPSLLPSGLDFIVNLFEASAQVQNRTTETLYITAITTTYGRPMVISQNVAFRQRDIPLRPNASVMLDYDSVDLPLSGIAVCRADDDCRLLAVDYSGAYYVESYEALPSLDPSWRAAIQSHPLHDYSSVLILALSLLPILLLSALWYVGRWEKQAAG